MLCDRLPRHVTIGWDFLFLILYRSNTCPFTGKRRDLLLDRQRVSLTTALPKYRPQFHSARSSAMLPPLSPRVQDQRLGRAVYEFS